MNTVYLLTGSNLDDRIFYLNFALDEIEKIVGQIQKNSSIYESASWGFTAEKFLNQVLCVLTSHSEEKTLELIQNIENRAGRVRNSNSYQSRTLDIDILFFNNHIYQSDTLTIPHPRFHLRRFTLVPLKEIAPDLVPPGFQKNIAGLASECPDEGKVSPYKKTTE